MTDVAHIIQKQLNLDRQFEELKKHVTREHEKTQEKIQEVDTRLTGRIDKLYGLLARIAGKS